MVSNRQWHVHQALSSFAGLSEVLLDLSAAEIIACLELESQSRRRKSVIDRLISRAARLNEIEYVAGLKQKYRKTP